MTSLSPNDLPPHCRRHLRRDRAALPGQDALQTLVCSPAYYFGLGDLLSEWNQLDAAEGCLMRGMEQVQTGLATEADVILRATGRGHGCRRRLGCSRGGSVTR
jgi:MalT-like TPR region